MGQKNSHEKHRAKKKDGKAAMYPNDADEPIFKENFGMPNQIVMTPFMPANVPTPTLPRAPPRPPHRDSFPPPPPPRRADNNRPMVPTHSTSTLAPQPIISRHSSNISTQSLPANATLNNNKDYRPLLIAKHRFVSQAQNEINLEEGDQIYLLNPLKDGWWYVETRSKQRGFVPTSHVKRAEIHEPWFAGNIPRIVCEQRVMQPDLPIGTFLIRDNVVKNTLVLTVRTGVNEHASYEICRQPNDSGFCLTDGHKDVLISFISLKTLVEYFSLNPKIKKILNSFHIVGAPDNVLYLMINYKFEEPIKMNEIHVCTQLTEPAPPIIDKDSEEYISIQKLQINRRDLTLIEKIGEGQFGKVNLAKFRNFDVAVKMMKDQEFDQEDYDVFLEEAELLTKLDHPNLIKLLAVCTMEKPYYIITEFMRNGSLLQFLKLGLEHNRLSTESSMNIAAQVARGMSYLSSRKVIHRDLAARNVLVGEISDNHIPIVKVADFGLARKLKKGETNYAMSRDFPLAVKWMGPETYEGMNFSTKSDVWSYGILIWEIGTLGKNPYREWSAEHTMDMVKSGYNLPKPDSVPDFVYTDAFLPCVDLDPENRPSFEQLFKYFDDDIRIAQAKRSRVRSIQN